jgi:hypothetical protein
VADHAIYRVICRPAGIRDWIGVSLGFSLAVPILRGAARLYGTLGSVLLFLIWTYLIAWILLLGGLLLTRPGWARAVS